MDAEGWVWVCQDVGAGDIPGTEVSAGAAWSRGHTAGGAGLPRGLLPAPRVEDSVPVPSGLRRGWGAGKAGGRGTRASGEHVGRLEVGQWEGTLVSLLGSEFPEARVWAEFKA